MLNVCPLQWTPYICDMITINCKIVRRHLSLLQDILEAPPENSHYSLADNSEADDDWEVPPQQAKDVINPETSSSSEESEAGGEAKAVIPCIITATPVQSRNRKDNSTWTVAEGGFDRHLPHFLGENKVKIDQKAPTDIFLSLSSSALLETIVYQINL